MLESILKRFAFSRSEKPAMGDDTYMATATVDQLLQLNPALAQCSIRVDKKTQQGSVIDVIRLMTGSSSGNARNILNRLPQELITKCNQLRINGKGRLTPTADAPTLIEIIWELPGKAAKGSIGILSRSIPRCGPRTSNVRKWTPYIGMHPMKSG